MAWIPQLDDEIPIDEDWLKKAGAEWDETKKYWSFHDDSLPLFIWQPSPTAYCWSAAIHHLSWPSDLWTRGCVRRLLVALQRDMPLSIEQLLKPAVALRDKAERIPRPPEYQQGIYVGLNRAIEAIQAVG